MRKETAIKRGFRYTGISSSRYEEVMTRHKELKAKGYRCLFVSEPPNPLSRGSHGFFYSVYAEQQYFTDRKIIALQKQLSNIPNRRADAIIKHTKFLQDLEDEANRLLGELSDLRNTDKLNIVVALKS